MPQQGSIHCVITQRPTEHSKNSTWFTHIKSKKNGKSLAKKKKCELVVEKEQTHLSEHHDIKPDPEYFV